LTKIFDLTQVGSNSDDSQGFDVINNNVQGYLMFGFLALYIYFNLWLFWGGLFHTPASAHGAEVDNLMNITGVLLFLFKLLTSAITLFAFKYRGKKVKSIILC
jgi:cytochrome c oxidase subunit 2